MKLIIFDIDGTLVDSVGIDDRCYIQAHKEVLALDEFNTNWEDYDSVTDTGIADEISRKYLGLPLSDEKRELLEIRICELLSAAAESAFSEIVGAASFFAYLKQSPDYKVAIATGGWTPPATYKLNTAGIPYAAVPMATSSDAVKRVDIMTIARERAVMADPGIDFEETLYFGDGAWDAKACNELGWPLIGIGEKSKRLISLGASAVFTDYSNPELILECINAF